MIAQFLVEQVFAKMASILLFATAQTKLPELIAQVINLFIFSLKLRSLAANWLHNRFWVWPSKWPFLWIFLLPSEISFKWRKNSRSFKLSISNFQISNRLSQLKDQAIHQVFLSRGWSKDLSLIGAPLPHIQEFQATGKNPYYLLFIYYFFIFNQRHFIFIFIFIFIFSSDSWWPGPD